MKQILQIFVILISIAAGAQQKNVFLERSFWETKPDVVTVKQKISEGNDPEALNENAFDAVVYALLENADKNVIAYLLSLEGNSVDKRTHDSRIYLHWAAYAGNTEIVKLLLQKGSSVTALGSHGNTPLTFAANSGQTNMEIYDTFIAHGLDISKEKNEQGANALLLIAPYLINEKDIEYFTHKGIDIRSKDNEGNGIFNYAAKRGNIAILKMLVNKGIAYKNLNKNGENAFFFAAQGTRGYDNPIAVYQYLQSLGLQANAVSKDGNSPLHRLALTNEDPAIITFFLSAGAKVDQKDAYGNTPFLNAASRNTLEIVQLLSENLTDFNRANKKGQTALMLALENNNPEVVEFLIQKGSNISTKDVSGNTLSFYLMESFDAKNPENFDAKLKILQKKGIQLNEPQADGNTLYHIAATANNLALAKRLNDFQIPINKKNNAGYTALHLAAMKAENDLLLRYFISIGADKTATTDFGETPFDLARENEVLQKQQVSLEFLK